MTRPAATASAQPLPFVREAVRSVLMAAPAYHQLDADSRRAMAALLVRVCQTAAALLAEEINSDQEVRALLAAEPAPRPPAAAAQGAPGRRPPVAQALATAGERFSGVAAERVAGTTRAILNAVSFPAFVTDLINGVFKAITDNNVRQMHAFIELLNNVSASTEGFADLNMAPDRAREWLVEHFPGSYEIAGADEDEDAAPSDWGPPEDDADRRVQLRPGAQPPSQEALRAALGLDPDEAMPTGDPDRTLVPLVRRRLAQLRQSTLATMVQLGLQRIVIEGGRIHASMRFHIDTRSAAQAESGSTFGMQNRVRAAGSFGFGAWGASASIENNLSYVSTQRETTTEEMNTDLELTSSVELIFRTDQVPLDRMAGARQTAQIMANARNPVEEQRVAGEQRGARLQQQIASEGSRRSALSGGLRPPELPPTQPGAPGTDEAARRAREEAQPPANRRETPANRRETPANRRETPANRRETPANRRETPAGQRETPRG